MRWTDRLSNSERRVLAKKIHAHRARQPLHNNLMYSAGRRLKHFSGAQFVGILSQHASKLKRPLRFFDSGAGLGGVGADIKRTLGAKVEVTTFSLRTPHISGETKSSSVKHVTHFVQEYFPYPSETAKEEGKRLGVQHRKRLDQAKVDAKLIDHSRVGLLENMKISKKYDVIFESSGPLQYSEYRERVVDRYYKMLPKGGLLMLSLDQIPHALLFGKFNLVGELDKIAIYEKK